MKRTIYLSVIATMVLFVTSCNTTQTLYTWYNYEDVAYEYNKEPTEERQVKVLEQYKCPWCRTSRYVCRIWISTLQIWEKARRY